MAALTPAIAQRCLIIDTDAGIDDAQALVAALRCPLVHVLAITCSHGNVSLTNVEGNVCAIVEMLGVDLPVYLGADRPLLGTREPDASEWHGMDGLGNTNYGATASRSPVKTDMDAPTALATIAIKHMESTGRPVDIVTLGPLTNLALALRSHPRMKSAIDRVYLMGGAYTAQGNVTMAAEYNIHQDPEAAAMVFSECAHIVMASWELTLKYLLPRSFVEDEYLAGKTPTSLWLAKVSRHLIVASGETYEKEGLYIPDPLCAIIACKPDVIKKSMKKPVVVELAGTHTRGMTVVDWIGCSKKAANVEIVEEVDFDMVKSMLLDSIK